MTAPAIGVDDSPYLLTAEAARLLRFKTAKLFYQWALRNRVPVLRRGRTLLYDRRVLEAFLAGKNWTRVHNDTVTPFGAARPSKQIGGRV